MSRIKSVFFDASYLLPDDVVAQMNAPASFVCPNCDGEITGLEHDYFGVCSDCYDVASAAVESIQHQHECHAYA